MVRNYLSELRNAGYTIRDLAKEIGISQKRVSAISRGTVSLPKSDTSLYENIRNANRRLAYQKMRREGATPSMAGAFRRTHTDPAVPVQEREIVRIIEHKQETTRWQLKLVADYYNIKTDERRNYIESYSFAHTDKDIKRDLEEAINEARSRLGDSNWQLTKKHEQSYMEYRFVISGIKEGKN